MTTMVSNSNNIEQVIYLWQDLVLSIQPRALLSTKSLIVISIVVFFIMIRRNGRMYYNNNLLNGFLTILLTIIFGKGLEILFRTLYIICSGAYGNVVFSLNDIFISLLFGCIFVSFGYFLLFNKKLREQVRHQKSKRDVKVKEKGKEIQTIRVAELTEMETKLKEKVDTFKEVPDKNAIVDGLKPIADYIQKQINNIPGLKVYYLQELQNGLENMMKELENKNNDNREMAVILNKGEHGLKYRLYHLKNHEEKAIMAGLEVIIFGIEKYKEILVHKYNIVGLTLHK
ncbi:hypothetical protein GINT2_001598 [Glugoides intestinalis]